MTEKNSNSPEFMDEKNTPTQPSQGERLPWGQNSKGEEMPSDQMIAGLRGQQSSQGEEDDALTMEDLEKLVEMSREKYGESSPNKGEEEAD